MTINISFKHLDASEALKEYTYAQTENLKKYFDGKINVHWTFESEKVGKTAHCHLVGNHMDYYGEATSQDFNASVDIVIDKLESQVRKHKEIVTNHLHR